MKSKYKSVIKGFFFDRSGKRKTIFLEGYLHKHSSNLIYTVNNGPYMYYDAEYINNELRRESGWYPLNIDDDTNYVSDEPIKKEKKKNDFPLATEENKKIISAFLKNVKFPEIDGYIESYLLLKKINDNQRVYAHEIEEVVNSIMYFRKYGKKLKLEKDKNEED